MTTEPDGTGGSGIPAAVLGGPSSKRPALRSREAGLLAGVSLALTVGILIAGYLYYRNYETRFRSEVQRQLSAIAELKVAEMAQYRKERLGDGDLMVGNAAFSQRAATFMRQPRDAAAREMLLAWLEKLRSISRYDRVSFVDTQGRRLLSAPHTEAPLDAAVVRRLPEVLASSRATMVDFFRAEEAQRVYLAVLVPVLDPGEKGPAIGAVVLRIDPEHHLFPSLERWPGPSRTAETLLVRREGNEAVFLNELKFQKGTALALRIPLDETARPAVRAALGKTEVLEGIDYRGVPVLVAVRPVPGSPWNLVARMDVEEALSPVREMRWLVAFLTGALILATGAGVAAVSRQARNRFYREEAEAAEALRVSAARFRGTFEQAAVGMAEVGLDGHLLRVNQRICDIVGYTREELLKCSFQDITHPEDLNADLALVGQVLAGERLTYTLEKRYIRKDLSTVWINLTVGLVRDQASAPQYFVSVVEDIAARKRAEEELEASRHLLRSMLDAITESAFLMTLDGTVLLANETVARRIGPTGTTPEGIRGENLYDLIPPDLAKTLRLQIEEAIRSRAPVRFEDIRMGRHILNSICPVLDAEGGVGHLAVFGYDITERKLAETRVRESEATYRTLVENIPQKIFMKDRASRYVSINGRFARDLRLRAEEVVGKVDADFFPPELAAKYRADDVRIMETGGTEELEEKYSQEGLETWVNTIKTPVRDAGGEIVGVLGIFWDITERKRAEEKIRLFSAELEQRVAERTAQLEAANHELEAFSSSVSHDLRAPLRHVQGYVDMLAREAEGHLTDKGQRYMKTIADASREMGVLIDDLLAFSRMGRAEMAEASVDLDKLVQDTLRDLETTTRERTIVWTIPPLPAVQADPSMLRLALANLLGNAVKFTRPRDPARIEMGTAGKEDGRVILFVRDNGVGFDPQYAHKLFGVFQRLHRTDEFEGTGIGLANVRRIIARHGGRTWAEGSLERGATFYFTLKASR